MCTSRRVAQRATLRMVGITGLVFASCGHDPLYGAGADPTCAEQRIDLGGPRVVSEVALGPPIVDLLLTIDNSASMVDDIDAVERTLNESLAEVLEQAGIDYRVILISSYGSGSTDVCIAAPLGGSACDPAPDRPAFGPRFFHLDLRIGSLDSLCKLLTSFNNDSDPLGDSNRVGWGEWLRPEARKIFIAFTDDRAYCSVPPLLHDNNEPSGGEAVAGLFDALLRSLSSRQFGSAQERNYVWHSVVGVPQNDPPAAPYLSDEPILTERVRGVPAAGTGYQALSRTTGGLRFSITRSVDLERIFADIATDVISNSATCEFVLPEERLPELSGADWQAEYRAGPADEPERLQRVESVAACDAGGFYVHGAGLFLCPELCDAVALAVEPQLSLLVDCSGS